MTLIRPTKLLLDGGDPGETLRIRNLLGHIDGQTTNPSLIAQNPRIKERIATGEKMSQAEQMAEYRKIVQMIAPLVGSAGVSIEVFSDFDTTAAQMLAQGEEMITWIPNAYIKYPCTYEGLKAAQASVRRGIRVNVTLCFSQEQAAAVYAATVGAQEPVYVSPFVGRLDDRGVNGMDLVRNIKRMYESGDGHMRVLAASLRHLDHLLAAISLGAELATAPGTVLEQWAASAFPQPGAAFHYEGIDEEGRMLRRIPYQEIDLNRPWTSFDIQHVLTVKGIAQFVAAYNNMVAKVAA